MTQHASTNSQLHLLLTILIASGAPHALEGAAIENPDLKRQIIKIIQDGLRNPTQHKRILTPITHMAKAQRFLCPYHSECNCIQHQLTLNDVINSELFRAQHHQVLNDSSPIGDQHHLTTKKVLVNTDHALVRFAPIYEQQRATVAALGDILTVLTSIHERLNALEKDQLPPIKRRSSNARTSRRRHRATSSIMTLPPIENNKKLD